MAKASGVKGPKSCWKWSKSKRCTNIKFGRFSAIMYSANRVRASSPSSAFEVLYMSGNFCSISVTSPRGRAFSAITRRVCSIVPPGCQISGTFQSPAPPATGNETIPTVIFARLAASHKVSAFMSRANQCAEPVCVSFGGSNTLLPKMPCRAGSTPVTRVVWLG